MKSALKMDLVDIFKVLRTHVISDAIAIDAEGDGGGVIVRVIFCPLFEQISLRGKNLRGGAPEKRSIVRRNPILSH